MLPPEEQIVPTHAKKLLEAQKAGTPAKEFSWDFEVDDSETPRSLRKKNLANTNTTQQQQQQQPQPQQNQQQQNEASDQSTWPLGPEAYEHGSSTDQRNNRATTPKSPHAGYSTVPKVTNQAPPIMAMPSPMIQQQAVPQNIHQPPVQEEKKKSRGCACIVM
jgi:hypothetical protein